MQLEVQLFPETPVRLPFSYYDKLGAALYSAIEQGDKPFSADLHDGDSHKNRIKMFCFSPLNSCEMEIHGGAKGSHGRAEAENHFLLFKGQTQFRIGSPWPELMNWLGEGLLKTGFLRIGSQVFRVCGAKLLAPPSFSEVMNWRPIKAGSIVTSWSLPDRNEKRFILPDTPADGEPDCAMLLRRNLCHKWKRLCEIRPDIARSWSRASAESDVKAALSENQLGIEWQHAEGTRPDYKTRLHQVGRTPVRSWRCDVRLSAPPYGQRLAWACGLGDMNSRGFGLVEGEPV